jgi:hypothetical protein
MKTFFALQSNFSEKEVFYEIKKKQVFYKLKKYVDLFLSSST